MKQYMVYFIIPDHEYDISEPEQRMVVSGDDIGSVCKDFMNETPEAYIKDIIELDW